MKLIYTTIIGLMIIAAIAFHCWRESYWQERLEAEQKRVLTVKEWQQSLNKAEPSNPIKVDGKVSPDWRNSETQKKADRIFGNQYAEQYWTQSGAPRK